MLLAIDTSTRTVGVALYDGVYVRSESVWNSHDYHTVELGPAIQQVLQRAGVKFSDLKALGVAIGPGSFTGLRVGIALAKGLALARHLPLVGIPTLDALAAAQPVLAPLLAGVLQAGRSRLAVGWYTSTAEGWKPDGPHEIHDINSLSQRIQRPTQVCGELKENERRILSRKHKNVILASPAASLRRPSYLAELAWQRWQSGQVDDPATLAPIYLHTGEPIPG